MSERKWRQIDVHFDNGTIAQVRRSDFDKLKEIEPVWEALLRVKQMRSEVNRLLGEAEV